MGDLEKSIETVTGTDIENYNLPCKPGDTVWCIKKFSDKTLRVKESTVRMVGFTVNGIQLLVEGPVILNLKTYTWNKDVFATKQEAEDVLKDLQEETPTDIQEFIEKIKTTWSVNNENKE